MVSSAFVLVLYPSSSSPDSRSTLSGPVALFLPLSLAVGPVSCPDHEDVPISLFISESNHCSMSPQCMCIKHRSIMCWLSRFEPLDLDSTYNIVYGNTQSCRSASAVVPCLPTTFRFVVCRLSLAQYLLWASLHYRPCVPPVSCVHLVLFKQIDIFWYSFTRPLLTFVSIWCHTVADSCSRIDCTPSPDDSNAHFRFFLLKCLVSSHFLHSYTIDMRPHPSFCSSLVPG